MTGAVATGGAFAGAVAVATVLSISMPVMNDCKTLKYELSFKRPKMLTVFPKPLATVRNAKALVPWRSIGAPPAIIVQPLSGSVAVVGLGSAPNVFTTRFCHSREKSDCGFPVLAVAPYNVIVQNLPFFSSISLNVMTFSFAVLVQPFGGVNLMAPRFSDWLKAVCGTTTLSNSKARQLSIIRRLMFDFILSPVPL